jgi:hypothetical protein
LAEEGMDLLGKSMAEVTHEMIGTLILLPYFEEMKRLLISRANRGKDAIPA